MSDPVPAPRQPDHPVDPMFPARWSPRAFDAAPVGAETLMLLLEAARWAPSASNHQPWRFVWALRGEAGFSAILGALVPPNRLWALHAAALIAVASKDTSQGRDGTPGPNAWAAFDAGAAWMGLALQASLKGLAAHAMGGFDKAGLAYAVGLPPGHSLHAVVAVGHPGPASLLPDALAAREAPNGRMPLTDLAFHGRFQAPDT